MQLLSTNTVPVCPHALVYGAAKTGKTRLIPTCPNPVIASADEGLSSIRQHNIPFVDIRRWADLLEFRRWLQTKESQQFQTVVFDDLTEIASLFLVEEIPKHKNTMQAYGRLNDEFMAFIRELRSYRDRFVLFLCKQERIKDELTGGMIYSPMIPGKAVQPLLPYMVGEVYHMEAWTDPNTKQVHEVLRTKRDAQNQYEAGSRSGKLNEIEFANMTAIFQKVMS